jgi:hypothetical protein
LHKIEVVLKINGSALGGSTGLANFSFDDQVVDLQGGGYCGWISPARRPAHDPIFEDVAYILTLRYVPNVSPTVYAGGPYSGNGDAAIAMSNASAIAYASGGPGVALAFTKDFHSFERYGVIMQPEDKDAALLPRRIDGRWALIHRPVGATSAHIWIPYSSDLRQWGGHKQILDARLGGWWDANKIGLSPRPLKRRRAGWSFIMA